MSDISGVNSRYFCVGGTLKLWPEFFFIFSAETSSRSVCLFVQGKRLIDA